MWKISTSVDWEIMLSHNLRICATFYILLLSAYVLINNNGENEEPNECVCRLVYWSLDQYWGHDQYQFSSITNCNTDLFFPDVNLDEQHVNPNWRTMHFVVIKSIWLWRKGKYLSIRMVTSAQAQLENTVPPCPQGLCISRWFKLKSFCDD